MEQSYSKVKEKTPKQILESIEYEVARERLRMDINKLKQRYSGNYELDGNPIPFALDRHAAPKQLIHVDYSCFEKTDEEKGLLLTLKAGLPKTRTHKFVTFFHGSY